MFTAADAIVSKLRSDFAAEGQALTSVQTLTSLWNYHYVCTDQEDGPSLRWKSNEEVTIKNACIESPYDTEVRYRRRYGVTWAGISRTQVKLATTTAVIW